MDVKWDEIIHNYLAFIALRFLLAGFTQQH